MKKIFIFLFLLSLCVSSQNYKQANNYISIGFLDHKTGSSAIGYTRSILQNKNNELFLGFGSMIAINTFTMGYKKYLFRSFVDGYSVISMQKAYGMGGEVNAAFLSIGLEKKIWKLLFINGGVNVTRPLNVSHFLTFPSLNLNIRY